jgi:pimeloyl-ACP methyl ester carboxylesterase
MKILFCHGLESGPHGRKFHALVGAGYEVLSPDCRGENLAARVRRIAEVMVAEPRPPLVVGSSFGGIAGLLAALEAHAAGVTVPGLVLCAPALQIRQPPADSVELFCPAPTTIIHGLHDEVIPIDGSRTFARDHGARLIEVDDDHSLAHSLDVLLQAVYEHSQ